MGAAYGGECIGESAAKMHAALSHHDTHWCSDNPQRKRPECTTIREHFEVG